MCVACLIGNGHFQNDFHLSISNAVLVIIFVLIISHIHFLITSCHCLGEFLLLIVSLVSGLLDYKGTLPLHLLSVLHTARQVTGTKGKPDFISGFF